MVNVMPTRIPTSVTFPICTTGAPITETNTPDDALTQRTCRQWCDLATSKNDKNGSPIENGHCDEGASRRREWPCVCHDARDEGRRHQSIYGP